MKVVGLAFLALSLLTACAASQNELRLLRVSDDKQALELQRSSDSNPQRVEVIAKCGLPEVGDPTIRWLKPSHEAVQVGYGKHCVATISIDTLKVACSGCD